MARPVGPNTSAGPHQLTSQLHDSWLDVDGVEFDQTRRTLVFHVYGRRKRGLVSRLIRRIPLSERFFRIGTLEFDDVVSFTVTDTEKIQYYDINEVRYNEKDNEVRILTGCPIDIRINVNSFSAKWTLA